MLVYVSIMTHLSERYPTDTSGDLHTDNPKDSAIREVVTRELGGLAPDAIFPLSGGIVKRRDGRWESTSGSDKSEHGLTTIGRVRTIAGAEIANLFPEVPVVANSYNRFNSTEPTMGKGWCYGYLTYPQFRCGWRYGNRTQLRKPTKL